MRHRRPDQPTGVRVGGTNFGQGRRGGGRAHRQVREDERAKEPKAASGELGGPEGRDRPFEEKLPSVGSAAGGSRDGERPTGLVDKVTSDDTVGRHETPQSREG